MLRIGFSGSVDDDRGNKLNEKGPYIMAVQLLKGGAPSPLARLADDYLDNCRARGLAPRSERQYVYSIHAVFLPWCESDGITDIAQLDRRGAMDK